MTRPAIEVADILRAQGNRFLERYQSSFSYQQLKAFRAIARCRTAALGGHIDQCHGCGYQAGISYNSCRSRCCPKCQAQARQRWIEAQQRDLLNTGYFHVVFTVSHELNVFALTTPAAFHDLLFSASSQTLLEVAADPKWLGAEIGFLAILHTWGSNLLLHPHAHCVVPAGGLSPDHQRWIHTCHPRFLLPIPVLRKVFRDKFIDGIELLYQKGLLDCGGPAEALADQAQFSELLEKLRHKEWVVYAKPPFGDPAHVLRYLGRYTHRIAISNHRLLDFDGEKVAFRYKDYAHGGKQRIMTLHASEFLRRFFLHVLPLRFVRIRHFGLLANRFRKQMLPLARTLLANDGRPPLPTPAPMTPTEGRSTLALPTLRRTDARGAKTYRRAAVSGTIRFFMTPASNTTPRLARCTPSRSSVHTLIHSHLSGSLRTHRTLNTRRLIRIITAYQHHRSR